MPASKLGVSPRGRLRADHRLCRQGRPSRESANRGPPLARLLLSFHRRITAVRPAVNRDGGGSNPPGGAHCKLSLSNSGQVRWSLKPEAGVRIPPGIPTPAGRGVWVTLQTPRRGTCPPSCSSDEPERVGYPQQHGELRGESLALRPAQLVRRFLFSLPVSRSGWVIVNQRYQRPSCTTRSPVSFRGPERLGYHW